MVYLHNICKREAGSRWEGAGAGGGGLWERTMFSTTKKMCGQNPVWNKKQTNKQKKKNLNDLENGSRSHNHCQICHLCHLCKLVQDYNKYRNSLTLLGVTIIATNANNNVDVIACLR